MRGDCKIGENLCADRQCWAAVWPMNAPCILTFHWFSLFFFFWAVIIVMSLREERISTCRDAQMDNSITFCRFKQLRGFQKCCQSVGMFWRQKGMQISKRLTEVFKCHFSTHARFLYKKVPLITSSDLKLNLQQLNILHYLKPIISKRDAHKNVPFNNII